MLPMGIVMLNFACRALFCLLLLPHGCFGIGSPEPTRLKYAATGKSPETLALYEGWFGSPKHISAGYSSHDPAVIRRQIQEAKAIGISAFVVDWFGDRDPFIDQSYALMQPIAAKSDFHVAMMYEEPSEDEGATDEVIADLTMFYGTYLSQKSPGHEAYLTYEGRPMIFVFRNSGHTDWNKVREVVNKWKPAPLLIDENLPDQYASAFDGFYPWINPGPQGWAADGSHWGEAHLTDFYRTMTSKYPDKIIVGGAWASFNDSKAAWSLNRRISARCGQTFKDTSNMWREFVPTDQAIPFVMIETWNDYEEGSAIEGGIPTCGNGAPQNRLTTQPASEPASPGSPQK